MSTEDAARVNTTLRLPKDLAREVRAFADQSGPHISLNGAMCWLLEIGLQATAADRRAELVLLARATKALEALTNQVDQHS